MPKKIYAQDPKVREQECDHPGGFPYRGAIPCTGPQICYLCGTHKEEACGMEERDENTQDQDGHVIQNNSCLG